MDGDRPHKAHRAAQSGGKASKKKASERHEKGFNPKVILFALQPSSIITLIPISPHDLPI